MVDRAPRRSYAFTATAAGMPPIDDAAIEDAVERTWFSCEIPRATLRRLMQRSDRAAAPNILLWLALLIASGTAGFYAWGSWWAVPAFFVYGTLYANSDARWHEAAHGTPFRTRWLNAILYHLAGFMSVHEPCSYGWSHAHHHTHTIVVGKDPEIEVQRPVDRLRLALDFFFLVEGARQLKGLAVNALGIVAGDAARYVPAGERAKVVWFARAHVAIYLGFGAWAIAIGSLLPLMYVLLPQFYGNPIHKLITMPDHAGLAENVYDHRLNTRSIRLNPVFRFLRMNMNHHLEHHMFPIVPFYHLPALHEAIKDQLPPQYPGLLATYRELLPALWRQARDPDDHIVRPLPAAAG